MSKISKNYAFYMDRNKIEKHSKYKETSHLTREKKEKLYDYYICDYCGDEIKILKKKHEMTGGMVEIPYSMTGKSPIILMLCCKCLRPVQKELEQERSGENHIPRID